LANRDEFYQRPTREAHWWDENESIFGGKDLQAGGSWLAVSKNGKMGAITNYRNPSRIIKNKISRGQILGAYMLSDLSEKKYIDEIVSLAESYEGYNLLFGSQDNLHHYSNINQKLSTITPGVHALSNHLLNTPWPKVEKAKKVMHKLIETGNVLDVEAAFKLFSDKQIAPDDQLPDTGIGLSYERYLSSIFIDIPQYGTRATTLLLIDNKNQVYFEEREYVLKTVSKASFQIK
jgi:uncharacterized protein with NRDE domain